MRKYSVFTCSALMMLAPLVSSPAADVPKPAILAALAEQRAEAAKEAVRIPSSADGTEQLVIWYRPDAAAPEIAGPGVPLLVVLHTWSGGFEQGPPWIAHARQRGWALLAPDFRGPNNRPEACASKLASQDILDAVAYARKHARIDGERIYLVGASGGGHMALVMSARAPQLWAGVSAWVPITDLAAWHGESLARRNNYAAMLEQACGGPPDTVTGVEYRQRSPIFQLGAAKDLPLDINTGIHDGHTGSVPVSHSLRAFNVLAVASGQPARQITGTEIACMVNERRIPETLRSETQSDPERRKPVLFRRISGQARITVFDGGHDCETMAALEWLSRQRRGQPADFSLGKSGMESEAREVGK